jgi:L-type amino acid transporter 5
MLGSRWRPGDLVLGMYGGLWSFGGWSILNYGTPEIRNARRCVLRMARMRIFFSTLPVALISGIFLVAIIYITMNIAYFTVLELDVIRDTDAIAAVSSNSMSHQPFFLAWKYCKSLFS